MWRPLLRRLGLTSRPGAAERAPPPLVDIGDDAARLLVEREGLPHVDWEAAISWMEARGAAVPEQWDLLRALGAAWLEALAIALPTPHERFRTNLCEGLAPRGDGERLARATRRSVAEIERALAPVVGEAITPPFGVLALQDREVYITLTAAFHEEEGEWGTSGGMYVSGSSSAFPTIVMPMSARWAVEGTIAHEFTHHVLGGLGLPLWVEEGLTQMMEERVAGVSAFEITQDVMERHRHRWRDGFEAFWGGQSFFSPEDDFQELSYHLSQLLVRSLLVQKASAFFAFAREATREDGGSASADRHLGLTLDELAHRMVYGRR